MKASHLQISTLDELKETLGETAMRLRRSNRLLQYAMHAAKKMNACVRAEFDAVHMELLNQLAEIEHIENEIRRCVDFRFVLWEVTCGRHFLQIC